MTAQVSGGPSVQTLGSAAKARVYASFTRLSEWLQKNEYKGYDTFDGLSARFVRPLTFENNFLRQVLQQGVRRFPINLRPLLGIPKSHSSKGMGYIARGFMRLQEATGDGAWRAKVEYALQWLIDNPSPGYSGACWGNHFDYQSRGGFMPKGVPTVVWTSLIGHAFLDAYNQYQKDAYLQVAVSACEHILRDLGRSPEGDSLCLTYTPLFNGRIHNAATLSADAERAGKLSDPGKSTGEDCPRVTETPRSNGAVHNANVLGAGLLARTYSYTRNESYRTLAEKAIRFTARHQRPNFSWWYGEASNFHWVDNFHTGYVLDSFKHYAEGTGDDAYRKTMMDGYAYWKSTFFLPDGTPRYYDFKTLPLDIQCCSQAIDTLVFFHDLDPESLSLALKVAHWTIENMQDPSGYFYYRRYSRWLVNKTPTLHWGQATMLCALGGLFKLLQCKGIPS